MVVVASGEASAQSDRDRAAARSAADAGVDAFEQGRYAEAVDLFSRAEQMVHAPPHLLFMARSMVKLGRLVDARENYLKITRERLAPTAPPAFKRAQTDAEAELAQIQPRLAAATITIEGDATGAEVLMDRSPLPAAVVGIPFPIDPGTHVFSARAGEDAGPEVTVKFGEGQRQAVRLQLPRRARPVAATAKPGDAEIKTAPHPDASAPTEPTRSIFTPQKIGGIAVLGVGAVGLGVGSYYLGSMLKARKRADDVWQVCDPKPDHCTTEERQYIHRQDADADRKRWISGVGLAVGGLGVIGGIILIATDNPSRQSGSAPAFQLVGGSDWVGARGTF